MGGHGECGRLSVLRGQRWPQRVASRPSCEAHKPQRVACKTHLTSESIDDGPDNDIGDRLRALNHDEGFFEIVGSRHLRAKGTVLSAIRHLPRLHSQTSQRSTVREYNVGDTSNDIDQIWVLRESVPLNRGLALCQDELILDSHTDHGDHRCDQDANDRKTREDVQLAPFSVVRQEDRRDGDDDTVPYPADGLVGECVQRLFTGKNVRSSQSHRLGVSVAKRKWRCTHLEDDTGTDDPLTPFTKDNTHGISVVQHTHVFELEIDHDPACEVGQDCQTDRSNDTPDHTQSSKGGRVRQQSQGDTLLVSNMTRARGGTHLGSTNHTGRYPAHGPKFEIILGIVGVPVGGEGVDIVRISDDVLIRFVYTSILLFTRSMGWSRLRGVLLIDGSYNLVLSFCRSVVFSLDRHDASLGLLVYLPIRWSRSKSDGEMVVRCDQVGIEKKKFGIGHLARLGVSEKDWSDTNLRGDTWFKREKYGVYEGERDDGAGRGEFYGRDRWSFGQ